MTTPTREFDYKVFNFFYEICNNDFRKDMTQYDRQDLVTLMLDLCNGYALSLLESDQ